MKYLKVWLNSAGQRTKTDGLSINQNSYDNTAILYAAGSYEVVDIYFKRPDGTISPKYHMLPQGYEYQIDSTIPVESGFYVWTFPIPYEVTSFTMASSTAKMDMSVACYYHNSNGTQLSPTMANAWVTVNGSASTATLESGYNANDIHNLWLAVGDYANEVTILKDTTLKKDQLITAWSGAATDAQISSAKLVQDSLALKLDDSQLISSWASATANNIANANLVLAGLNSKINNSQLVTAWSATPLNANIASEKLVKDSLDAKLDDSQLVTSWQAEPLDTDIPSEKLVKSALDLKMDQSYFTQEHIINTIGTAPVQRATGDENGARFTTTYVKAEQKGVANGVATLDSNAKVPLSQIPDSVLGQMLYAGTIDNIGSCALSDSFKAKYNLSSLSITQNIANDYSGSYWIATAAGTLTSSGSGFQVIDYNIGDWIVSNGAAGYVKVDNTDAVQGVKGNAESSYRTGYVNLTPANIGAATPADVTASIGKNIQLDFTGTLSGTAITFNLTNSADYIAPVENSTYEIDLHFPVSGAILDSYTMAIVYGGVTINISNIVHNTGTMTVGSMKQLQKYSNTTGYRWIFNAVYNSVGSTHYFGIPATVIKQDIIMMSNEDLLDYVTEGGLENGQLVLISSQSTTNGYYLGHTYKVIYDFKTNSYTTEDITPVASGMSLTDGTLSNIIVSAYTNSLFTNSIGFATASDTNPDGSIKYGKVAVVPEEKTTTGAEYSIVANGMLYKATLINNNGTYTVNISNPYLESTKLLELNNAVGLDTTKEHYSSLDGIKYGEALGKVTVAGKKYLSSMLGDQTGLTRTGTDVQSHYITFHSDKTYVLTAGENTNPYNIKLIKNHRYLVYTRFSSIDVAYTDFHQIVVSSTWHWAGTQYYISGTNELFGMFKPDNDYIFKNVLLYSATVYFTSTGTIPSAVAVIDVTNVPNSDSLKTSESIVNVLGVGTIRSLARGKFSSPYQPLNNLCYNSYDISNADARTRSTVLEFTGADSKVAHGWYYSAANTSNIDKMFVMSGHKYMILSKWSSWNASRAVGQISAGFRKSDSSNISTTSKYAQSFYDSKNKVLCISLVANESSLFDFFYFYIKDISGNIVFNETGKTPDIPYAVAVIDLTAAGYSDSDIPYDIYLNKLGSDSILDSLFNNGFLNTNADIYNRSNNIFTTAWDKRFTSSYATINSSSKVTFTYNEDIAAGKYDAIQFKKTIDSSYYGKYVFARASLSGTEYTSDPSNIVMGFRIYDKNGVIISSSASVGSASSNIIESYAFIDYGASSVELLISGCNAQAIASPKTSIFSDLYVYVSDTKIEYSSVPAFTSYEEPIFVKRETLSSGEVDSFSFDTYANRFLDFNTVSGGYVNIDLSDSTEDLTPSYLTYSDSNITDTWATIVKKVSENTSNIGTLGTKVSALEDAVYNAAYDTQVGLTSSNFGYYDLEGVTSGSKMTIKAKGQSLKNYINIASDTTVTGYGITCVYSASDQTWTINGTSTGTGNIILAGGMDFGLATGTQMNLIRYYVSGTVNLNSSYIGYLLQGTSSSSRINENAESLYDPYINSAGALSANSSDYKQRILFQVWAAGMVFTNFKFKLGLFKGTDLQPFVLGTSSGVISSVNFYNTTYNKFVANSSGFPVTSKGVTISYDSSTQTFTASGTATDTVNIYLSRTGFSADSGSIVSLKKHYVSGTATIGSNTSSLVLYNSIADSGSYGSHTISLAMTDSDAASNQFASSTASADMTDMPLIFRCTAGVVFTDYQFRIMITRSGTEQDFIPYSNTLVGHLTLNGTETTGNTVEFTTIDGGMLETTPISDNYLNIVFASSLTDTTKSIVMYDSSLINPNLSITELSERMDVVDSRFRGKTIAVWGTSVESNAPSSDPNSPSSLDDSWPALLGQMVHANILNYGASGTTLAVNTVQTDAASAAVNRILTQDTSASADIILISEGLNDFKLHTPLGDPTNKTIPTDSTALNAYIATFYGAIRVMLTRAETKYPGKPIYWIMPQKRSDESTNYGGGAYSSYRKAIVDVCNEFGVQIIDWYNMIPNLAGTPGYSQYMLNETHFNHAGNTLVANIVRKALIGSLPDAKVKEYELPAIPQTNGTYKLQVVITGGIPAFSWVAA